MKANFVYEVLRIFLFVTAVKEKILTFTFFNYFDNQGKLEKTETIKNFIADAEVIV